MKQFLMILPMAVTASIFAADQPMPSSTAPTAMHRYLVERTFPAGAIDGIDAAAKQHVNATNARFGVRWVQSYATTDKSHTYCIYEGPSEQAIRAAAQANQMSADRVTEIPTTLLPD